jgi:transposase
LLSLLDHPHDAKQLRRAQALVWLDEGQPVLRVAELLHVEPRTVYNWAYAFRERTALDPLARLLDAPSSGRPPTALGIIDPLIDAVMADDPRSYGYRSTMWTASLLQRYLEEIHAIATSRKSVSRAIARLGISHQSVQQTLHTSGNARLVPVRCRECRTVIARLRTVRDNNGPVYCWDCLPQEATLGQRLKARRLAKGMTLMALGKKTGISWNLLSKYERDAVEPKCGNLLTLIHVLGVALMASE